MDKLSVIGKIGTILSDLKKQQEYFSKSPQSLNEVEVELFAASANYLAEYAKVLKKFPVSRVATSMMPPGTVEKAMHDLDEDDIGFRLSAEEEELVADDKKIHQVDRADQQKPQISEHVLAEGLGDAVKAAGASGVPDAPANGRPDAAATERPDAAARPSTSPADRPMSSPEEKPSVSPADHPSTPAEPVAPIADAPAHRQPVPPATPPAPPAAPSAPAASPEPERSTMFRPETVTPPEKEGPSHTRSSQSTTTSEEAERLRRSPSTSPGSSPREPHEPQEQAQAPAPQAGQAEEPRRVSLNERFSEKKATLYERITQQQSQEQQPTGSPIANLGRSIGINERYYFIKTLFQGDKVAFDQAITRIDICHSLGEALEYTNKSIAGKYGWNRKEDDARKFYELLKRRFV